MIWMLALLGCGEKDVGDTGAVVEDGGGTDETDTSTDGDGGTGGDGATGGSDSGASDSGGSDSGSTDGGSDSGAPDTEATLRAEQVFVDLELYTPPEGRWEVEAELYGDGLFTDRVGRIEVSITPESSLTTHELSLVPSGSADLFVSAPDLVVPEGGLRLEPLVVEGEKYALRTEPEVQDVEYEEVEDAALPMLGTWELPESYNSPMVFGAIDGRSGELLLKTTSRGDADHYPVGAFRLEDGEILDMHTQSSVWRAGDDAPTGALERGTPVSVKFEVYDDKEELADRIDVTAMYGDIIMGGVALDDFND